MVSFHMPRCSVPKSPTCDVLVAYSSMLTGDQCSDTCGRTWPVHLGATWADGEVCFAHRTRRRLCG